MRVIVSIAALLTLGCAAIAIAITRSPVPVEDWFSNPVASLSLARGENPHPVRLLRPAPAPLSALALLGRQLFFDKTLSGSGKIACASCHDPQHFYGPSGADPAVYGGIDGKQQGVRAVPSLMYLDQQPNFSVGPDNDQSESALNLPQLAAQASGAARVTKTAQDNSASAANLVPQGGLFWDGRADTLQNQAFGPLLSPFEMDGGSIEAVAARLRAAPYAAQFTQLFGPSVLASPRFTVAEALSAIARYEVEDPSFHPYTSQYDYWLEGRARLSAAELRGYILFNDPVKGDCAACHVDQPSADNRPPLLTDHQFEALGVQRNPLLKANADPHYFDLGICGPYRTDMQNTPQYCAMFLTPTLRNAATRQVFFHNGVDHTLKQVLDFYDFRDTNPEKVYPRGAGGKVAVFDDIPQQYWKNIDTIDPPLDRHLGDSPALTEAEENDIIAFLRTLTDGYPVPAAPGS